MNDSSGHGEETSTLAALVRRARATTELGLDDFARLVGTDPQVVAAWERGARTPPPIGVRLLDLIVTRPEVCVTLVALEPTPCLVARTG